MGGTAVSEMSKPRRTGVADSFVDAIAQIAADHDPARDPFFQRLREAPTVIVRDPAFLAHVYNAYQPAMRAARAAAVTLPHLEPVAMPPIDRAADFHHQQITHAFERMGALFADTPFDSGTEKFISLASTLHARSLGPWCVIARLAPVSLRALAEALCIHFPGLPNEPGFAACFGVIGQDGDQALQATAAVLRARPELYCETLLDAAMMTEALNTLWRRLDAILRRAEQKNLMQWTAQPDLTELSQDEYLRETA